MLSYKGWIDGISALLCFIFAILLGLGIFFKARKLKVKLLSYMGLNISIAGFFWIVPSLDFLIVIVTGRNLVNIYHWMGIVNFMWAPLVTLLSMYIWAELMIPRRKKLVFWIFMILSIIFWFIIFLNPSDSFLISYPSNSGAELIYIFLNESYLPIMILYFIFSLASILFCGIGYLIKSFRSKGVIKRKFQWLSIGYFIFLGFPLMGTLFLSLIFEYPITIVRIGMISSFLFFYYGLREEPIKKVKEPPEKDIIIKESLFRLTQKPKQLTKEDITFHKEQKICLVCKSKLGGSNLAFICLGCAVLYCEKCVQALTNVENACWVCNKPFDESKSSKPFKDTEEESDIEVSEKKKNKN
ncbi:hypothetical protein LCGC14_2032840 [marine sediment metagenome]|uniref:Uncharacterized protein n=1 Tax=marine sediment metagenome TaxID=412755 RepID=A0A0F9EU34_9ZZZZ